MSDEKDKTPLADTRGASILNFFANPWIGITGSLASVVGVVLAIYFYLDSSRYPELVCYVNPARAEVVKQGTASRLAVSFDGHPISQDVTAAQVAIWNRGKEPVRRSAVLQPLVIRTNGKVPILEATVRKKSRDVVQLELNQTKMVAGELELSWNVLESGDGGVVQILYAGGPDVRVQCTGVLEGQPAIRELQYSGTIRSPSEQMQRERRSKWAFVANGVLAFVMFVIGISRFKRHNERDLRSVLILMLMPLGMIGFSVYMYATLIFPDPPFGFD